MPSFWKQKKPPGSGAKLIQYISNTTYVQNYAFYISMAIMSSAVKLYFVTLLCYLFSFSPIIDFFIQIAVSVIIHFVWSDSCVKIMTENSKIFHVDRFVKRIVSNITEEKLDLIKKTAFVGSSVLAIVILHLVDVTSHILILYIFQNLVIVITIDILSKIDMYGAYKLAVMKVRRRYEWMDPAGALKKRIEPVVIHNSYMKPPTRDPCSPTVIVRRIKEKKIRRFRITSIGRYLFPRKY